MNIPENLKYTTDHEWVMIEGERAKVGITDYAQDALGDVVFVDIPEVGKRVTVGETVTELNRQNLYRISMLARRRDN